MSLFHFHVWYISDLKWKEVKQSLYLYIPCISLGIFCFYVPEITWSKIKTQICTNLSLRVSKLFHIQYTGMWSTESCLLFGGQHFAPHVLGQFWVPLERIKTPTEGVYRDSSNTDPETCRIWANIHILSETEKTLGLSKSNVCYIIKKQHYSSTRFLIGCCQVQQIHKIHFPTFTSTSQFLIHSHKTFVPVPVLFTLTPTLNKCASVVMYKLSLVSDNTKPWSLIFVYAFRV